LRWEVDCPACGRFLITDQADLLLNSIDGPARGQEYILSAVVRRFSDLGTPLDITTEKIAGLIGSARVPENPDDATHLLLGHIRRLINSFDSVVDIYPEKDYPEAFCRSPSEFDYLITNASLTGFINIVDQGASSIAAKEPRKVKVQLTPKGWKAANEHDNGKKQESNISFVAYCCGKPMLKEQRAGYVHLRCADPNHGRWFAMAIDANKQSYCSCDSGRSPLITKDFGDFRLYGGCQYCGARYSVYKEGVQIVFEIQGSKADEVKKVSAKGMALIWDHLGGPGFGTDAKSIFSKQNLAEMIKSIRPDITLKVGNISDSGDVIKSALRKGSRRREEQIHRGYDAFIIHQFRTGNQLALNIKGGLEDFGITTFVAPQDVPTGANEVSTRQSALKDAKEIFVIITNGLLVKPGEAKNELKAVLDAGQAAKIKPYRKKGITSTKAVEFLMKMGITFKPQCPEFVDADGIVDDILSRKDRGEYFTQTDVQVGSQIQRESNPEQKNSEPRESVSVCHLTKNQVRKMGRTLSQLVGLEYRADNASDLQTILNRALRMVVHEYSLIPDIALRLGVFTVEIEPSQGNFVLKGNPDVCLIAEQLIHEERPHIPELDT